MMHDVTTLSLAPICSLLDGTDEGCAGYSVCNVCWEGICHTHSDAQTPDGRTDPVIPEPGVILHRACVEFWK